MWSALLADKAWFNKRINRRLFVTLCCNSHVVLEAQHLSCTQRGSLQGSQSCW